MVMYKLPAWSLGPSGQWCSMTEKFQVQLGERGLQETQTGVHAWNHLTFGVTKNAHYLFVSFIRVFEFSPVSFFWSKFIVTNTIPKAIDFPHVLYSVHKMYVSFSQFGIHDIKYGDWNRLSAVRTRDGVTHLSPLADTLGMTWLVTAC